MNNYLKSETVCVNLLVTSPQILLCGARLAPELLPGVVEGGRV